MGRKREVRNIDRAAIVLVPAFAVEAGNLCWERWGKVEVVSVSNCDAT